MRKLALFFVIISGLFAQQITGAFGLKLGDKLTKYKNVKILEKETNDDGTLFYTIVPPKKISYFNQYYILTSPIKKTIYQIFGFKKYDNFDNCKNREEYLEKLLEKKYGKFKVVEDSYKQKLFVYKQKNRFIIIGCQNKITNALFGIIYEDENLKNKAIQEAVDMHKNELNDF